MLAGMCLGTVSGERTWLEQQFGDQAGYMPLLSGLGRSGEMPLGWSDASGPESAVHYAFVQENGIGFLRATGNGSGKLQFMIPLKRQVTKTTAWRIKVKSRSPERVGLLMGIRQLDRPDEWDRFFASALFDPGVDWSEQEFLMRSGADPKPAALYLNFGLHGTPATLDIAWIKLEQIDADHYVPPTTRPLIREEGAVAHHHDEVELARKQQPSVIFLGDSITQGWNDAIWDREIAPLNAVNFGIGANTIQHVLWQVQNMELGESFTPKVVVLMIGINNYFHVDSDIDIVDGMANLLAEIHKRSPHSRILLLGLLPQGRQGGTLRREELQTINRHYASMADGKRVAFLDFGAKFLDPDGTFPARFSADATHLTPAGYEVWAKEMLPALTDMLKLKQ